jgi:hypothetical protein
MQAGLITAVAKIDLERREGSTLNGWEVADFQQRQCGMHPETLDDGSERQP